MSEEIQEGLDQPEASKYASVDEDGTIKVNLTVDPVKEEIADEDSLEKDEEISDESVEKAVEASAEDEEQEEGLIEVVDDEEDESDTLHEETKSDAETEEEAIAEASEKGIELPENIQKVVEFMQETGGTLEDYVKLNTDFSSLNEEQLLREYFEAKYTAYDKEDIDFLMSDKFDYDEDIDDEVDIRRKKIARKEALVEAKNHFDSLKNKYYDEIKMGSRLTPEQQKAVEFFNRYNKESEEAAKVAEKQALRFKQESEKVFGEKFEGFDYKVGDKKYRFKVKDASKVKDTQSDINNFIKKFLNENNELVDAKGYHKSLFTAMNADQIAQHFYEQGKSDALKSSVAKAKNVDMDPRGVHEKVTTSNGWTVRAVDPGESSSKLKVKFRK